MTVLCACCNAAPARRPGRFCGQKCRQRAWRFARHVAVAAAADVPKRIRYADPPYPGKAYLYLGHPDYAGEVDHRALVLHLDAADGWALSTDERSLHGVLDLCTELGTRRPRVGSWVRGGRPGRSRGPMRVWEPVVYVPARAEAREDWPEDALVEDEDDDAAALVWTSRPRTSDPNRVVGAKPPTFSSWLFGLLDARRGDTFEDLFPGSGAVSRAWELYASPSAARDASSLQVRDASQIELLAGP